MILCIEIGGTKLQLGAFAPDSQQMVQVEQRRVVAQDGASGILEQIQNVLQNELGNQTFTQIGVGFGGPVSSDGIVFKSHQIAGWDQFNLAGWFHEKLDLPVTIANDCDTAALAEARFGAARSARSMFYMTVGTGVGGGWVVDGQRQANWRPSVAEIGHLRPGLACTNNTDTVESIASGWGIANNVHRWMTCDKSPRTDDCSKDDCSTDVSDKDVSDKGLGTKPWDELTEPIDKASRAWYQQHAQTLTAIDVAQAATADIPIASRSLQLATNTLGWALAQVATLLSPDTIVVGGGVAKLDDQLFWQPLRTAFQTYVFGPVAQVTPIVPAELGDDVVLYGAAALTMTR